MSDSSNHLRGGGILAGTNDKTIRSLITQRFFIMVPCSFLSVFLFRLYCTSVTVVLSTDTSPVRVTVNFSNFGISTPSIFPACSTTHLGFFDHSILNLHFPRAHLRVPIFPELIQLRPAEFECQSEHRHIIRNSDHGNAVRNKVFPLYQIQKCGDHCHDHLH